MKKILFRLSLLFSSALMVPELSYSQWSDCFWLIYENGPVDALWNFDGNTNDTAYGRNPTGGIGPSSYSSDIAIDGQAAYFDGSGGIQLDEDTFMTAAINTIAFGAWFKPDMVTGSNQMLFDEGDNNNGISIHLSSTGNIVMIARDEGAGSDSISFPFPTDGEFHHIAFTYNAEAGNRLVALLDGEIKGILSYTGHTGNIDAHTNGSGIGQEFGGQSAIRGLTPGITLVPFKGYIDEAFYTRQLIYYGSFYGALLQYVQCHGYSNFTGLLGCPSEVFMSQTDDGIWTSINLGTGDATPPTDDNYSEQVNAIGFNEYDGLIYGIANGKVTITEITESGGTYAYHTRAIGIIPELVGKNIEAGDILPEYGWLFVRESTSPVVYVINVLPLPYSSYLRLIDIYDPGTDDSINVTDWAFTKDNPWAPRLFAIDNNNGDLLEFDISGYYETTGTHTVIATGVVPSGDTYGAVYIDDNNYLYAYRNSDGNIYRINLDGPDYTGFLLSTSIGGLNYNDGASCGSAPITLDFGDLPDISTATEGAGVGTGQYNTMLSNNGPRHNVNVSVPLRLGATVSIDNDGKPNSDATMDLDDGIASFPAVLPIDGIISSYEVEVTATNASSETATIYAWIDWNNNGVFEPEESVSTSVPASTTDGTFTLQWVNANLSNSTDNPGVFARFRISTDTSASSPVGPAQDGEVEDYFIPFDVVTPMSLISFNVKTDNCHTQIYWEMASEDNLSHYIIEKSVDGNSFMELAQIKGNNNSLKYHYTDSAFSIGDNFYRLKIVDNEQNFAYSEVKRIQNNCSAEGITLFPNPSHDHLTIKGVDQNETIIIYDMLGKKRMSVITDSNNPTIDIRSLNDGIYYLTVMGNNNQPKTIKFQKIGK